MSLSISANAQDISRIFFKSIDDSTVVLKFGRYRILITDGTDSAYITQFGAEIDTVPFAHHTRISALWDFDLNKFTSDRATDSVVFDSTDCDLMCGFQPDVEIISNGWPTTHYDGDTLIYSHRLWMIQTPLDGECNENPTLYWSDDKINWYVPFKIDTLSGDTIYAPIPLSPAAEMRVGSDAQIIIGGDGNMYAYWRLIRVGVSESLFVKSSSNGIDWGDSTLLIGSGVTTRLLSPAVLYDDDGYYRMWTIDYDSADNVIRMEESSTPDGFDYNKTTLCTLSNVPADRKMWQHNIVKVGGLYVMVATMRTAAPGDYKNYLAKSYDGINFTFSDSILTEGSDLNGAFDSSFVYMGDIVPRMTPNGYLFDYWYTGYRSDIPIYNIGYTTIEFPLDSYFDTAATVDTIEGLLVDHVTDANLTDTLNSYSDTAATVDTILSSLLDVNIPDGITIDEASDVDTSGTKISAALGNRIGLLVELFAYLDRTYFDTAADAGGDSIIVVYSDSTDLSIFDTDDLTQGASNLYNQTHTGDVTGATELTIAANAVESTMIGADQVNDLDINFGAGTDQVSSDDLPAHTGDVTGGTALTIAANAVESTMIGADQVNDLDINFGAGTDQVNTDDIPEGTAKYNVTHTGDVTGATELTIAANIIDTSDMAHAPLGKLIRDTMASELHTRSHTMISTSDHTAGNYKLFHSNGSGEVQELAHGASSKVLTSGGASSAPTWEIPSAAWDWQDSAGEPPYWVDSAKYSDVTGGIENAFVGGELTVTGPISHYNFKSALDSSNWYTRNADTVLRLLIPSDYIDDANDSFQVFHTNVIYIPGGKFGYRWWLTATPYPDGNSSQENPSIWVSSDGDTWHEFFVGPESTKIWVGGTDSIPVGYNDSTLHNPIFNLDSFNTGTDSATHLSDPDIVFGKDGSLYLIFRCTMRDTLPQGYDTALTVHRIYSAHTTNGLDWSDTTLIIDGLYNSESLIERNYKSLSLLSPSAVLDTQGICRIWMIEDSAIIAGGGSAGSFVITLWEGTRMDSTLSPANTGDTLMAGHISGELYFYLGKVTWTLPDSRKIWHGDVIQYAADQYLYLVNANIYSPTQHDWLYAGLSVDGDSFVTIGTAPLLTKGVDNSWNEQYIYHPSGIFIDRGDYTIFRMYYSGMDSNGVWGTAVTEVYIGKTLESREALIWNPDLITDTVPVFPVDSAKYPKGIEIQSLEVQTSEDGIYALKFMIFTAADPPVFHDWIDTLNVGASDQRASSETFEDYNAQLVDRGQFVYILTPDIDIDWIRWSFKFYVRE